jgi:uncharacterized protein with GYD domain
MVKYLALFNFGSDAIRRFVASPSDRTAVVKELVESVEGRLECYYWMFGQYDGMAVIEMPDAYHRRDQPGHPQLGCLHCGLPP